MEPDETKTFTVRNAAADGQQQTSNNAGRVLSLRIPVSTLFKVGASSEFLLEPFSGESEVSSGVLRKSHDVHEQDDALTVRVEPTSTHIYKQQQSELIHVGNSTQRLTIQTGKEVEALGRKARESLEEEQRKRREIVRLEHDPEETSTNKRSGIAFAQAIRNQRPRPSSTLKRKHVEKFSDAFRDSSASAGSVDTWKPNVSHVSQCAEGERSSIVRLHGLPLSVKPESIRRFFSGLDLERIFVLLPNETRIRVWDERKHPSDLLAARHAPSFRVYVKFVSSPAADMALARSEEYLYVDGADKKKMGVHIAMTKITKTVANYLQQNMALDGVNGCALQETLAKEEARLGPRVSSFLWTMTARDLNISSLPLTLSSLEEEDRFPWHQDPSDLDPLVFSDYQKLARHYNSLVDEYERMEQSRVSVDMEDWDPSRSTDAATRIKRAASDRLLEEIENVKHMLYRARVDRRRSIQSQ